MFKFIDIIYFVSNVLLKNKPKTNFGKLPIVHKDYFIVYMYILIYLIYLVMESFRQSFEYIQVWKDEKISIPAIFYNM